MMSFELDPDGSKRAILIRGTIGPPLLVELLPEDFQMLRGQLDNIERMMSEARKQGQH
jgi:hypothetical protein